MKTLIMLLLLMLSFSSYAGQDYKILTGSETGTYYSLAKDIKRIVDSPSANITILSSAGSTDNINRLLDKEADFAIVQYNVLADKDAEYKNKNGRSISEKIKILLPLHNEEMHVAASVETEFVLGDKSARKICTGEKNSGSDVIFRSIAPYIRNTFEIINLPYSECIGKVKNNEVDFVFYTIG